MPYIKQEDRNRLNLEVPQSSGELNYLITQLVIEYMRNKGDISYQTINDIMDALDGAKSEFYRRIAAPYEDKKIKENGDVY